MIRVESKKLTSEECDVLATLTIAVRKGTVLESERSKKEVTTQLMRFSENDGFQIYVAYDESEDIVGWLNTYVGFPLMTFISGFEPVVHETERAEEIALSLIEAAKRKIVECKRSRLEIELVFPTDAHRVLSEKVIAWYRKSGFEFATEEVHMSANLAAVELLNPDLPEGYILRKFSEIPYEQIEAPGLQTFESSKDALFTSMSHAEQKVTLEHFFDHASPFVEDASLILEQEGSIMGFIITRMNNEVPDIGPIGLVPEARGQGLGTYLLVCALKNIRDSGHKKVELDTSITNHPAKKLYELYGFRAVFYKQFYYWSP